MKIQDGRQNCQKNVKKIDKYRRYVIPRTLFVKIDLSLDLASEHLTDEEKTC